jgi:hypothetical protein
MTSKQGRLDSSFGDGVLDLMWEAGVELTRENYLALAYLGNPPEQLDAEAESELPEEFRVKTLLIPHNAIVLVVEDDISRHAWSLSRYRIPGAYLAHEPAPGVASSR